MSDPSRLETLKKIAELAKLAGVRGQTDESRATFSASFTLPDGRSQVVHVRHTMAAPDGSPLVSFMSPCVIMKSGLFKGVSKEQAMKLLQMNEKIPFARYGLMSGEDSEMIVASMDVMLDHLDPAEFNTYIWSVAAAADRYEAEHRQDKF